MFHKFLASLHRLRARRRGASRKGKSARCLPRLEALEDRLAPAVFKVNSGLDLSLAPGVNADGTIKGTTTVTLRSAIEAANATAGGNTIDFSIPGKGVRTITITPGSPLPIITNQVLIDGYSQPGASRNTLANGDNANLLIALNGNQQVATGLAITTGNCLVRGLMVYGFTDTGIRLSAAANSKTGANRIVGNSIGTNGNSQEGIGNQVGVSITNQTQDRIGGNGVDDRNVISGNTKDGILITTSPDARPRRARNQVLNNFIGTNVAGATALGNGEGVEIVNDQYDVVRSGNVIAGNFGTGVLLDGTTTASNRILGNTIGLNVNGGQLGNSTGVGITGYLSPADDEIHGPSGNEIGGPGGAGRNTISGNGVGVSILTAPANQVANNYIGTNKAGSSAGVGNGTGVALSNVNTTTVVGNVITGNVFAGVSVSGTSSVNDVSGNWIGVNADGTVTNDAAKEQAVGIDLNVGNQTNVVGNVISGNKDKGIAINMSDSVVVQSNTIGLGVDGKKSAGVQGIGISIETDSASGLIGGAGPGEGNYVSGNTTAGIAITGASPNANKIQGNIIGPDEQGRPVAGGQKDGILLNGGFANVIGGTRSDLPPGQANGSESNVISGNTQYGVHVTAASGGGNVIQGNFIGTDGTGMTNLGNGLDGVLILNSPRNTVGGSAQQGNVISGNGKDGVRIEGLTATANQVLGNLIGADEPSRTNLANGGSGVEIAYASRTVVAENLISGNRLPGILIVNSNATGTNNVVQTNIIGTDAAGDKKVPNLYGVQIAYSSNNVIGGPSGEGNRIAGNSFDGIKIVGDADVNGADVAANNRILGNFIGVSDGRTAGVGNGLWGVALFSTSSNLVALNVISANGTDNNLSPDRGGVLIAGDGKVAGNIVAATSSALPTTAPALSATTGRAWPSRRRAGGTPSAPP
jgi:parallel beta-helix repeat protein